MGISADPSSTKPIPHSPWPILAPFIVLGTTVIGFVGSAIYVEYYAKRLSETSLAIVGTTVSSLEPLADMRIQLHRLVTFGRSEFNDVDRTESGSTTAARRIQVVKDARARLNEAFRRYVGLPEDSEDSQPRMNMAMAIERLDRATDRAIEEAEASIISSPSMPTMREMRTEAEYVTGLVMDDLTMSGRYARIAQASLQSGHSRTLNLAHWLDALCAIAAIIGSGLAAHAIRRQMRLSEQFTELQSARAAELEQFAGRVAHDILGPLQAVSLGLGTLERRAAESGEASSPTIRIRRSLNRVVLIVDGLLRFARAGARPEADESVDLRRVVDDIRDDLLPTATDAGVCLTIEQVPNVRMACSQAAVTIVLENLIRNAIKYIGESPLKTVTTRAEIGTDAVHLTVEDSGPGLPVGWESRVFEPYIRGLNTRQPGIGLGLATVKRIVEAHGGRVGVDSKPGQGASFWVELPRLS